jgi:glyoxylase I family protein
MEFKPHHTAISVGDLQDAEDFYSLFGFRAVHRYLHPDGSFAITHLLSDGYVLELFWYAERQPAPDSASDLSTDLPRIGTKHHGVRVTDVDEALAWARSKDLAVQSDVREGRTGVRYFFVRDPSGNFFEISQDDRVLNPLE